VNNSFFCYCYLFIFFKYFYSRLKSDIAFASICGFQSLLVGCDNGAYDEAEKIKKEGDEKMMKFVPDTFLASFSSFMEFLCTEVKAGNEKDKKAQETKSAPVKQQIK